MLSHCSFVSAKSGKRLLLLLLTGAVLVVIVLYREVLDNFEAHKAIRSDSKTKHHSTDAIFKWLGYVDGNLQFDQHDQHNESGFLRDIVPDVIHYIQLDNAELEFITLISIMSVLRNHRPRLLLIHSDRTLSGKYWNKLVQLNASNSQQREWNISTIIQSRYIKRPKYIFGKKLSSVFHSSDIARIAVLRKFGGIYLDNDVYVVKPLHHFRKYEFTIGWPEGQFMGTQVLICHRNARFLKLWHQSYRHYKPSLWYYNAGEYPTTKFLEVKPDLVHRVKSEFGVHYLVDMLYRRQYPYWQHEFYTIHLLFRHRPVDDSVRDLNEYSIINYNCTFGEMARLAYCGYESANKCHNECD